MAFVFALETLKFSWTPFFFPSLPSPFPPLLFTSLGASSHLCKTKIPLNLIPTSSPQTGSQCQREALKNHPQREAKRRPGVQSLLKLGMRRRRVKRAAMLDSARSVLHTSHTPMLLLAPESRGPHDGQGTKLLSTEATWLQKAADKLDHHYLGQPAITPGQLFLL